VSSCGEEYYSGQADGWTARHSGSILCRRNILYFTAYIRAQRSSNPPIEVVSKDHHTFIFLSPRAQEKETKFVHTFASTRNSYKPRNYPLYRNFIMLHLMCQNVFPQMNHVDG
jgi:hypothetical protein